MTTSTTASDEALSASYTSLLNSAVVPAESIEIKGGKIALRGVTVFEVITLLRKFPHLRGAILKMLFGATATKDGEGDASKNGEGDLAGAFIDAGPEPLATFVATAAGERNNADFVRAMLQISDDDQVALLDRTIELTMPRGAGDFFGRFGAVARRLGLTRTRLSSSLDTNPVD